MMLEDDFFLITTIISYGSCVSIYYMPTLWIVKQTEPHIIPCGFQAWWESITGSDSCCLVTNTSINGR